MLILLVVLTSGCATTHSTSSGGGWKVLRTAVQPLAPQPLLTVVINNNTEGYLEVRLNGQPKMAKNQETKEMRLLLIEPHGSIAEQFSAFFNQYEVVVTVVSRCISNTTGCFTGRMYSRNFYIYPDGSRVRAEEMTIRPGMLQ